MNYEIVKQQIFDYIETAYHWHNEGEGSLENGAGKRMVDLEGNILSSFGLPSMAQQYSDILQAEGFLNTDKERRADKLIATLKKEAERFLLSPIENDVEVLLRARNIFQDVVEVLPMIGITTSVYNCFLYYDAFFRGRIAGEEALHLFKKSDGLDESTETKIPYVYNGVAADEAFYNLANIGLQFLDEYKAFLHYKSEEQDWNKRCDTNEIEEYFSLGAILTLKHFYITRVFVKNEETCCITLLKRIGKTGFVELSVWCVADIMRLIMLHAKYYSFAAGSLYASSPQLLREGAVDIPMKLATGKNIEIENIKLTLERLDDENDDLQDPFSYVITGIQQKDGLPVVDFSFDETDDLLL